jgi:transcription elongation factor GreA
MSRRPQVTRDGIALLEKRLRLLEARLAAVVGEKGEAASTGGNAWHDNFSFEQLEHQERTIRHQIAQLRVRLSSVELVDEHTDATGLVAIGSEIDVRFDDGTARRLRIVGHGESDPTSGKIAYDTPLGAAVLGASVSQHREFNVGRRRRSVTVERIG